MYLNLKVDKRKRAKYGTPCTYCLYVSKSPIFSLFIESKKKVVVIKGAMSTNGYENVSPSAFFKSSGQPTIYECNRCPDFFLASRDLGESVWRETRTFRSNFVFLLIPLIDVATRVLYKQSPKVRRSRCLRTCQPFLFTYGCTIFKLSFSISTESSKFRATSTQIHSYITLCI